MAQKSKLPALALRSNTGVEVWNASNTDKSYVADPAFARDESKNCRALVFSHDGKYLAWANGTKVHIATPHDNWRIIASLPRPKAFYLKFSPRGTYLMTWEIFTTSPANPEGAPNLYFYETTTGNEAFSCVQKRQIDWEPHWSSDESLVALMCGGEVLFYELQPDSEGLSKPAKRLGGGRNGGAVSLSPGNSPHIGFYVPGVKGAPSMCKLFKYPNIEASQPVAQKSFFQADNVQMIWNSKGTGLLLLTSTDVDNTGVSYYGKQALHFINTKGDSFSVQLNVEGPIHSVAWSPRATEFCVVYGYMPSKATLFNLKCDQIFDFGTGPRNAVHFNSFGNLVLFGGFGNLRGQIEVWDMDQKKQVSTSSAPDTTQLEWSPAGDIYVTATCAPRLRIGNGFKIWHYSGALLHETLWPEKQELWEVAWQNFPEDTFAQPVITDEKIEGIQSSTPQASKAKYVPPSLRNLPPGTDLDEKYIPGLPAGYKSSPNGASTNGRTPTGTKNFRNNNQQRRPNRKSEGKDGETPKKENKPQRPFTAGGERTPKNGRQMKQRPETAVITNGHSENDAPPVKATPEKVEKDPKMAKIHKKLREIRILKDKQEKGDKLDGNQKQKLESELQLVQELSALKLAYKTEKQNKAKVLPLPQTEQ
ncbi:eukaryotic translation initiation factor 2A-like [Culicoides brevitarsis]|uniref:eukaryotic translation initiation factor 2A-like n=1 Tax=Culicoides brevitarsis TaxID=469753 RepID=UPI00307C206E